MNRLDKSPTPLEPRPIFEGSNQRRFRSNYSPKEIYTLTKQGLRLAGVWERQDEWWWDEFVGGGGGWNILRVPYLLPPRVVQSQPKPTGPPLIDLPWLYLTFITTIFLIRVIFFRSFRQEVVFRRGFGRNTSMVKGEQRLVCCQKRSPLFKRR